jgi:ring-1,2-phenylacetyl-CoA epoxidase subunit PaaE
MATPSFHLLKVKEVREETPECVSILFDLPENLEETFRFLPGQYLTLRRNINGTEVRRSYSICSAPQEGELRVAVKNVREGKFSGFANQELKAGDELEVMPPLGKFSPREAEQQESRNYLAIAVGSGITPVMSIMKSMLQQNKNCTFTLIYGNKSRGSIIFKDEIEALKNRYMERLSVYHIFTRETAETPLFNGRINSDKLNAFYKTLLHRDKINEVFICGPEEVILNLREYFIDEQKMDTRHVHFELFSSPDQPRAVHQEWEEKQQTIESGKVSKVTVRLDGTSYEMDLAYGGDSILDTALLQGLDLPYACKGGVCCTCRAKLLEGAVDMEVNYALEEDEIANNFILTCQSHPRSEKVVIDFDVK